MAEIAVRHVLTACSDGVRKTTSKFTLLDVCPLACFYPHVSLQMGFLFYREDNWPNQKLKGIKLRRIQMLKSKLKQKID